MEEILKPFAEHVALAAELACVVCIALGGLETIVRTIMATVRGSVSDRPTRRDIWRRFASWIMFGLEFALAADIARTAIAPTWDDIGQLAAIAVIRTALNYFLEKDFEVFGGGGESTPRKTASS